MAPETPFIFVSGIFGEVHAVEMMRLGANDYVLKQSMELLAKAVERALLVVHERRERAAPKKPCTAWRSGPAWRWTPPAWACGSICRQSYPGLG